MPAHCTFIQLNSTQYIQLHIIHIHVHKHVACIYTRHVNKKLANLPNRSFPGPLAQPTVEKPPKCKSLTNRQVRVCDLDVKFISAYRTLLPRRLQRYSDSAKMSMYSNLHNYSQIVLFKTKLVHFLFLLKYCILVKIFVDEFTTLK